MGPVLTGPNHHDGGPNRPHEPPKLPAVLAARRCPRSALRFLIE